MGFHKYESCFSVYRVSAHPASALLHTELDYLVGESEFQLCRNKLVSEQTMGRNGLWDPSEVCRKEKDPFGLPVERDTTEAAFLLNAVSLHKKKDFLNKCHCNIDLLLYPTSVSWFCNLFYPLSWFEAKQVLKPGHPSWYL